MRTITALAIAALAEAAAPYGIESFDTVLKPLWNGIKQHRGKVSDVQLRRASLTLFVFYSGSRCISQSHWLPDSVDGR